MLVVRDMESEDAVKALNGTITGASKARNAANLIDNDPTTMAEIPNADRQQIDNFNGERRYNGLINAWFQYDFNEPTAIKGYALGMTTNNDRDSRPCCWELMASNDQQQWVTLDLQHYAADMAIDYYEQRYQLGATGVHIDYAQVADRLLQLFQEGTVLMQEGSANVEDWSKIPSLAPFENEIKSRYPYRFYSIEGLNIMSKYPFTTQTIGEPQTNRTPLGYKRNETSYLARAYDLQLPNGKQLRLVDFRFQSYHLSFGKNMNVRLSPYSRPAPLERMRRSFALRSNDAAALRKALDDSPANLIVCGDMNDVPSSHVYRVLRGNDLNDAWADAGRGYAYTYNRFNLRFRIDHVFYRGDVRALHAERLVGGSSDHYPLVVSFDIDKTR